MWMVTVEQVSEPTEADSGKLKIVSSRSGKVAIDLIESDGVIILGDFNGDLRADTAVYIAKEKI